MGAASEPPRRPGPPTDPLSRISPHSPGDLPTRVAPPLHRQSQQRPLQPSSVELCFGHRFADRHHVSLPWFFTISATFSAAAARAYCISLPIMGLLALQGYLNSCESLHPFPACWRSLRRTPLAPSRAASPQSLPPRRWFRFADPVRETPFPVVRFLGSARPSLDLEVLLPVRVRNDRARFPQLNHPVLPWVSSPSRFPSSTF